MIARILALMLALSFAAGEDPVLYSWHASVDQFDWTDGETYNVTVQAPVADLPQNYTNDDVIAWGREHGVLAPAEA